ncbi:autotransporter outer membrane beta-barrel domain-containing protein [Entomobacter blattae]|uniref:Uncharacterized protein n=1 Tax=Entomobacter blattae TaxID=2762277 RepID=A0A7H1NP60_9PROT|nr:hypothetical protein [Entomobacter blattae]QNT77570.1 hypothetical protein JGUZn3_03130 [Entomobacter blattae]
MEQIFTDISKTGPKIQFNTGNIVNGSEEFNKVLPDVDGTLDTDWNLTAWHVPAASIFNPATPTINDINYTSPVLGIPRYTWATNVPQSNMNPIISRLSVYGQKGDYTYQLSAGGGYLHDIFLQTFDADRIKGKIYTFDHPIELNMQERITSQGNNFGGGYVVFNSFSLHFNFAKNPNYNPNLTSFGFFLQIPTFDSRGEDFGYTEITSLPFEGKLFNNSSITIDKTNKIYSDASVVNLQLSNSDEQLHNIKINLNAALLQAVQQFIKVDPSHKEDYSNLKNWSLGNYYGGIETNFNGESVLSVDIKNPTFLYDSQSLFDTTHPSKIEDIDDGKYTYIDNYDELNTIKNSTNTIKVESLVTLLSGATHLQTINSYGNDTVFIGGNKDTFATTININAYGKILNVKSQYSKSPLNVSIQGNAPIITQGNFDGLNLTTNNSSSSISGTIASGNITLNNTVAFSATGFFKLTINNGNNYNYNISNPNIDINNGTGRINLIPTTDIRITNVNITGGTEEIYTATSSDKITNIYYHSGKTKITNTNDTVTIISNSTSGNLDVVAGAGKETTFLNNGNTTFFGTSSAGSQIIIGGNSSEDIVNTVYGGTTQQEIWTGNKNFLIVASQETTVKNGTQNINLQGGTSTYWGGAEITNINVSNGNLTAFLGNNSNSILINMSLSNNTTLSNFSSGNSTLQLTGISTQSQLQISHVNNDTLIKTATSILTLKDRSNINIINQNNVFLLMDS